MKIILGEVYTNRTKLYLTPIVNTYGKTLVHRLNQTSILAWGLWDELYLKAKGKVELRHHLFMLQDPKGKYSTQLKRYINQKAGKKIYREWLEYVRGTRYFEDGYPFGPLTKKEIEAHMIIFKIPEKYRGAYDKFLEDKFSQMYTPEQIDEIGVRKVLPSGSESVVWKVLRRDEAYREAFVEKINEIYGTRARLDDVALVEEFDSHTIEPRAEIFNLGS